MLNRGTDNFELKQDSDLKGGVDVIIRVGNGVVDGNY